MYMCCCIDTSSGLLTLNDNNGSLDVIGESHKQSGRQDNVENLNHLCFY